MASSSAALEAAAVDRARDWGWDDQAMAHISPAAQRLTQAREPASPSSLSSSNLRLEPADSPAGRRNAAAREAATTQRQTLSPYSSARLGPAPGSPAVPPPVVGVSAARSPFRPGGGGGRGAGYGYGIGSHAPLGGGTGPRSGAGTPAALVSARSASSSSSLRSPLSQTPVYAGMGSPHAVG